MTPNESHIWASVYAAIMQGLASNPNVRLAWTELRERATAEANAAIRTLRSGPL